MVCEGEYITVVELLACVHLHMVISAVPIELQLDACTLLHRLLHIVEHPAVNSLSVQHHHLDQAQSLLPDC